MSAASMVRPGETIVSPTTKSSNVFSRVLNGTVGLVIKDGQRFHGQAVAEPLVHQAFELQRQRGPGVAAGEERLLGDRAGHRPGPVEELVRRHDLVDGAVLLGG